MEKIRGYGGALVAFLCFAVILGASIWLADISGIYQSWQMSQEVKRIEAEAQKVQSELQLQQAKDEYAETLAQLELARGQKNVLDAAAASVENNNRIVKWYAIRNDVILIVFAVLLAAIVAIVASSVLSVSILKGKDDVQKQNGTSN